MLQQLAALIGKNLGYSSKASNGWIEKVKKRQGIRYLAVTGELLSSCEASEVDNFVEKLKNYIAQENLSPCQIYNCDETGLFYKPSPKKTLVTSDEARAPGRKVNKERITVQLCSNATGDNKIRLMLIGRYMKPRCFKNFVVDDYVCYTANRAAWMTTDFFKKWFTDEFVPMVRLYSQKMGIPAKAVLIMDNASSHPDLSSDDGLIKVMFLPPRSTPLLQPMDIGIIRSFKSNYNSAVSNNIANKVFDVDLKALNLKHVVEMAKLSWESITKSTIINCFSHLFEDGFILQNLPYQVNHFDDSDDVPLAELSSNGNTEVEQIGKIILKYMQ